MARHLRQTFFTLLLLIVSAIQQPVAQSTPVVAVEGDHFVVNGAPAFLIFVSYFDALHASSATWETDLTYLHHHGINGIRIFPNWFGDYCNNLTKASDTLFNYDGTVKAATLQKLKDFLTAAASHQLVVDVTFTRDTIPIPPGQPSTMPVGNYQAALQSATSALTAYKNVIFDVQNEWSIHQYDAVGTEVQGLVSAVHASDPQRAAAASRSLQPAGTTPTTVGTDARTHGFDYVAFHDARDGVWYTAARISAEVADIRTALQSPLTPVHLQEPQPFSFACNDPDQGHDSTPGHHRQAAAAAKQYGAAAWTFHTRSAYHLPGTSLLSALNADPNQKAELEAIRGSVDAQTAWGIGAFSVSPTSATVSAVAGSGSVTVTHVAGSTGGWQASSNQSWLHVTASGTGASVPYSWDQNTSLSSRVGVLTIAGRTVTITQAGQTVQSMNGDNHPDLVWRHYAAPGDNAVWFMNGLTATDYAVISLSQGDLHWEIRAVGDFNHDTKPDLIWQNNQTGVLAVWYLDGATLLSTDYLTPSPEANLNWKIVGAADMNRDGYTDLIWENRTVQQGRIRIWHMVDNVAHDEVFTDGPPTNTGWEIAGVGDMNGDGKPDLVWRDYSAGWLAAWYMDDNTVLPNGTVLLDPSQQTDPNWRIVGVADIADNGVLDGKPDLIWQLSINPGTIAVWYMNGVQLRSSAYFNPQQPSGGDSTWHVVGVK